MNVTVYAPMSLQKYPYDRHIVPFCLATRATNDGHGEDKKVTKWELCKEWPEWAPFKYPEDKAILSETQATKDLEYDHEQCYVYLEKKKPILCVVIERPPMSVMTRVALPVFIVVSIAISISGIKGNSFQDEYNAALTSLLTLTAFSYSVQSSLPKLPYLTWADKYFLVRRQLCCLDLPQANSTLTSPFASLTNPCHPPRGSWASSSTSSSSSRSSSHRKCASTASITRTGPSCWATQCARNVATGRLSCWRSFGCSCT